MINAIHFYRIARWLYLHHIPILPKFIQLVIFIVYNCNIPYKANIGKGSFLNHAGMGVLINPHVSIGENTKIGNNCSIVGQGPYKNAPIIGNHVYIGPGAVIQGPVVIDDNVIIAPNCVVTKSVPQYDIVAGVPAKIIGDVRKLDYDIFKNESWNDNIHPYLENQEIH